MLEIAFAAGFGSLRQFNRACQDVFKASPRELRARRRVSDRLVADGGLCLRLPFYGQLDWGMMIDYFAARAIPGVEHVSGDTYRRTVVIGSDPGVLELMPGGSGISARRVNPRTNQRGRQTSRPLHGYSASANDGARRVLHERSSCSPHSMC